MNDEERWVSKIFPVETGMRVTPVCTKCHKEIGSYILPFGSLVKTDQNLHLWQEHQCE